jgi:hypothetical protein
MRELSYDRLQEKTGKTELRVQHLHISQEGRGFEPAGQSLLSANSCLGECWEPNRGLTIPEILAITDRL